MIAIYKDTNTINSLKNNNAINSIERLAEDFPDQIIIEKTDVLDTELEQNYKKNANRLKKSSTYIESFGIAVVGHSRLGHCIVASDKEDKEIEDILSICFNKKPRRNYSKKEMRDAMHIHTAIRYGGTYFITYDKKLIDASNKILERFNSTRICIPEACLDLIYEKLKLSEHWQGS